MNSPDVPGPAGTVPGPAGTVPGPAGTPVTSGPHTRPFGLLPAAPEVEPTGNPPQWASGAQPDEAQPVIQAPQVQFSAPPASTVWEQMGGPAGMLDSGLPVVVFVLVNAFGPLGWAIAAAVAAGLAIAALRLLRHKPVTQALAGLFGVGIAAFIAHRTGSAKGYFLFGIWSYVLYGSVLLGSILVRRPLIGLLWESVNGRGTGWRRSKKLVRRYDAATAVWVLVFAARFAVQKQLYAADQVGWLATARLLMGYPLYLLAILATVLIVGSANGMTLPSVRGRLARKPARPER